MERLHTLLRGKSGSHIRPFLWMRGEENSVIGKELDRIEECGIKEVCLESRPHPDFCGDGWWENLDYILPRARERGMKIWILDDDKFPTGHANGGFIRYPDKKKIYLAERHMDLCGPCRDNAVLVENFLGEDGRLLGILAVPKPDGETLAVNGEGSIDLTERCENGFVFFDLPEGRYRLFVLFTTSEGGGREDYMNLIDPESVRILIDEVYEKHYQRYGEYFGNTIAGFFSDEPELGNKKGYPFDNTLGQKDVRLPWSRQLEKALRKSFGGHFLSSLPALWYDSGDKTARIRSVYMDEMTNLVKTCFSEQLGNWCAEHGVEYIGHVIEDDNAHTRMACSIGHYFRAMTGMHMAGIDVVHHQIVPGFTEPVHQWIAGDRDGEFFHYGLAKLCSSAAHLQENKKGRALCEIFGNYGWAEGISFMKWLTNHMLVRGINEFTPHAFSMKDPDSDCPPHFYAGGNQPGFLCFVHLMKYMNRGAELLSGGICIMDAAILYHAEAEWSGAQTMYFQKPGRKLMERQLDYDVVPADVFTGEAAKIEKGMLVIRTQRYPCLILPYARYLNAGVIEFVDSAVKQGLKVFQVQDLPEGDGWGEPLPDGWESLVEVVSLDAIAEKVIQLEELRGGRRLEVEKAYKDLRSLAVSHDDAIAAMYFNESVSGTVQTQIRVRDKAYGRVTVYDPWNNRAECFTIENNEIPLCLEPGEALFLYLEGSQESEGTCRNPEYPPFPKKTQEMVLDVEWKVSRAEVREDTFTECAVLPVGKPLPNMNGRGYFPSFTGTYRYESSFVQEKAAGNRYMLYLPEAHDCVRVWMNGTDCGYVAGFPARVEITDALEEGENILALDVFTTLVWERKDGASTHLQIPASGITKPPVIECYRNL